MDFTNISSLDSYMKNINMQKKWESRQKSGNYRADGAKTVGEWIEDQTRKKPEAQNKSSGIFDALNQNNEDAKLSSIRWKMARGDKLDNFERQYLQAKDPAAYRQLQNIEAEQAKFEEDLKRCRTKDEAQKLKMYRVAASLSAINQSGNDPSVAASEQQKMAAIERVMIKFVESGGYAQLPTDAEKTEAERILRETEQEKLCPDTKETAEAEKKEEVIFEPAENISDSAVLKENAKKDFEVKTKEFIPEAGEKKVTDTKTTQIKAEQSDEVRKLKRSKKPDYTANISSEIIPVSSPSAFEAKV